MPKRPQVICNVFTKPVSRACLNQQSYEVRTTTFLMSEIQQPATAARLKLTKTGVDITQFNGKEEVASTNNNKFR